MSVLSLKFRAVQDRATNALTTSPAWARWQSLSGDRQRGIQWGVLLFALILIWTYLWLPAARGREALTARIPILQSQLATMQREADEIKRINAMPAVLTTGAKTLADTVALQTIFGTAARVSLDENRQFRVNISGIIYTAWLDHLDTALNRYRLQVISVKLKPLQVNAGNATLVNVELILADDTALTGK